MKLEGNIMGPAHPRWDEFTSRLAGGAGYEFHCGLDTKWPTRHCTSNVECPLGVETLRRMGFTEIEITLSFRYWEAHQAFCDCEVLDLRHRAMENF
jgi:hypothetical protein